MIQFPVNPNHPDTTGEAQFESQFKFLQCVLEAIPDAILVVSPEGIIHSANKSVEAIFGYTPHEVLGMPFISLFASPHREEIESRAKNAALSGKSDEFCATRRVEGKKKDGSVFPVSIGAAEVALAHQTLFAVAVRDITKIINAESELEKTSRELHRSNQELEQFAAIVSHDLQAPLRSVSTFASFLERQPENLTSQQLDRLSRIRRAANRMQNLISSLLHLAGVNKGELAIESLSLNEIFEHVLNDLDELILSSGATITRDELPQIDGNCDQIRQLLQNLIANAIKFRKSGELPIVHMACKSDGGLYRLSVQDNGIGVSGTDSARIFKAFSRLHSKTEYPGTGLGLAICRKIVERHGGEISVESEKGKGSCFNFTLPKPRPG